MNMLMRKRAGVGAAAAVNTATQTGIGAMNIASEIISSGAVYLLAAAAATGIGAGYLGAKITSHGKQDEDTAKKEYENERLKADLGYLSTKTKSEYQQFKEKQAVKPARVIA